MKCKIIIKFIVLLLYNIISFYYRINSIFFIVNVTLFVFSISFLSKLLFSEVDLFSNKLQKVFFSSIMLAIIAARIITIPYILFEDLSNKKVKKQLMESNETLTLYTSNVGNNYEIVFSKKYIYFFECHITLINEYSYTTSSSIDDFYQKIEKIDLKKIYNDIKRTNNNNCYRFKQVKLEYNNE